MLGALQLRAFDGTFSVAADNLRVDALEPITTLFLGSSPAALGQVGSHGHRQRAAE